MRRHPILYLAALLPACAGPAASQHPREHAEPIALTNVTIIPGNGAPAQAGMTIELREGRIAAIYQTGSRAPAPRITTLDLAGHYVIPGLIDAHVHLATVDRPDNITSAILRFALLGGVTTVRDMGGNANRVMELARRYAPENAASPRIYGSAVFAGPRWFTTYDSTRVRYWSASAPVGEAAGLRRVDANTDIAAAVRTAAALGVRGIKLYSDLSPQTIASIDREARAAGLQVWSHAVSEPSRVQEIAAGGAVTISHADQLLWASLPAGDARLGDRAARAELLRSVAPDAPQLLSVYGDLATRGVMLEPTLLVMQMGDMRDGEFGPLGEIQAWAVAATRAAHRSGVRIVAGTDAIGQRTPNIHLEMRLLVEQAGLTPVEAIQAATQHGAMALGIADSTGTVEVGKWADVVVLGADPRESIRNTAMVRMVFRRGYRAERR